MDVKDYIRTIPDFPVKGIMFRDVTTVIGDADGFKLATDELIKLLDGVEFDAVVGIESRGFIVGPAVAIEMGAGFVPIRKSGKLPAETLKVSYDKEYGKDTIEMHKGALNENDVVLIHDDILATGGSMLAAVELVQKAGVKKIYTNCLIELEGLNGRQFLSEKGVEIDCLLGIEVDE